MACIHSCNGFVQLGHILLLVWGRFGPVRGVGDGFSATAGSLVCWKSNHHFLWWLVSEFHHYFSKGKNHNPKGSASTIFRNGHVFDFQGSLFESEHLEASHVRDAEKVEASFIHGNQAAFIHGATDEHFPFRRCLKLGGGFSMFLSFCVVYIFTPKIAWRNDSQF